MVRKRRRRHTTALLTIDPSITMKFFCPFDLTPLTVLTKAPALPTSDLPGSKIKVTPSSPTSFLTTSMRSLGVGMVSSVSL